MNEIFDRLKPVISENLGDDVGEITLESNFMDDMGADSLDMVEMIMAVEEELDIEIPDSTAERLKTVGDLVNYIHEDKQAT